MYRTRLANSTLKRNTLSLKQKTSRNAGFLFDDSYENTLSALDSSRSPHSPCPWCSKFLWKAQ